MDNKNGSCIDAGSVHCPCMLAACNECMICGRLAGKNYCDCDWQGVCIYNEYLQNGSLLVRQRKSSLYKIQKKIWYEKDLAVMRIKVPRGFAQKASVPGSCVFVRPQGKDDFFDMPVSVMNADYEEGFIDLAVKASGPKSRTLLDSDVFVQMRGVYRNGLLGADKLKASGHRKVLCLTKGVGLAPAVNYCRWAAEKDLIDIIIDLDKINRFFAEDCLTGCCVNDMKYGKLPLDDANGVMDEYDLILVCASDYFQENIRIPQEKLVVSNNFTMCCGEGVCGACIHIDESGNMHRMCKCREK